MNEHSTPKRRTKKAEQRAETIEQILDAAEDLFSKHGLYGVTLKDVAKRVGVHHTLLNYYFSDKKALFAAGVQFPSVTLNGTTFHPGQANNVYIYPAIGLANHVARPRRITDECFIVAAEATADQVDPDLRAKGMLFPSQADILASEVTTATRVAELMFDEGLAQVPRPRDVRAWIEDQLYTPRYEKIAP